MLPLLNGIAHLEYLDFQLPSAIVLGGTCHIGVTLDNEGNVLHLNPLHSLTYGARTANQQQAVQALEKLFANVSFNARCSNNIQQKLWEKWVMLATLASMTCLMRGNIGAITRTPHGAGIITALLQEACTIASAEGFAPRTEFLHETTLLLTDPASTMTASMLRDIEKGFAIEADHIIGELVRRGHRSGIPTPLLNIALTHLNVYEENRRNAAR